MAKFMVTVERKVSQSVVVEVEAKNYLEAMDKAEAQGVNGELDFNQGNSVDSIDATYVELKG